MIKVQFEGFGNNFHLAQGFKGLNPNGSDFYLRIITIHGHDHLPRFSYLYHVDNTGMPINPNPLSIIQHKKGETTNTLLNKAGYMVAA